LIARVRAAGLVAVAVLAFWLVSPARADAATIFGAQPASGNIILLDPATGAIVRSYDAPDDLSPGDTLVGLSMAEEGASLIYRNDDGSTPDVVYRLDPATGAVLSTIGPTGEGFFPTDGLSFQSLDPDQFIYSSHSAIDIHRQAGFGGPETFAWATGAPVGGLGGDDMGREYGFFTDGSIHRYRPFTDTDSFISTLLAPAADIEGLAYDGTPTGLYASTASGTLYTLDRDTGAEVTSVTVPGGGLFGLGAIPGDPPPPPLPPEPEPEPPAPEPLQAPGPPVAGESFNVRAILGVIRFKRPGGPEFSVLEGHVQLPIGTIIDARDGVLELTSASDQSGGTRTGFFYDGVFKVLQSKKGGSPVTLLKLRGRFGCGGGKKLGLGGPPAVASGKKGNGLWGNGGGGFKTKGKGGSASTRGTIWFVGDRCDGTTIAKVKEGKVRFRDFELKKTITLKAGDRYVTGD
jgi:hypothetical protein